MTNTAKKSQKMASAYSLDSRYKEYLEKQRVDLKKAINVKKHCRINIDPSKFTQLAKKHQPTKKWHHPRPFLSKQANMQMELNNRIGYNEHNSMEWNWGIKPEHNSKLQKLVGKKNFVKIGIAPDKVLVRLLLYTPGQQLPLHQDGYEGFASMFKVKGKVKRFFVAVSDWDWGHALQVHDKMITKWQTGDTYYIPAGVFHTSANFGIAPKYTLTITGVTNGVALRNKQ